MAIGLSACASAEVGSDQIELTFATGESETSPNVFPAQDFMEAVTEQTDGRVTWTTHYSGTLLPSTEVAAGVKQARVDAGVFTSPYDPTNYPLYNVGYVPYPETNTVGATRALQRMYEEGGPLLEEAEANNTRFILHTGSTNGSSLATKTPIDEIGDISGMQIRVIGGLATGLDMGGASAVAIPVEETFEAIERGVIDGIAGSSIASLVTYSMPDLAPEISFLPTGHYSSSIGMIMNQATWDSLPEDVQEIMNDLVATHYEELPATVTQLEAESCDALIDMGANFGWFPNDEAERDEWSESIGNAMFDEWRETATSGGRVSEEDAQAVEDTFKQYAKEEAEKATDYTPGEEECIAKSQGN